MLEMVMETVPMVMETVEMVMVVMVEMVEE